MFIDCIYCDNKPYLIYILTRLSQEALTAGHIQGPATYLLLAIMFPGAPFWEKFKGAIYSKVEVNPYKNVVPINSLIICIY